MGHRRRGLILVLAALVGLERPPASASANPVLAHVTRSVTGESALLSLNTADHGVDPRASQSLRLLMRDTTTGRSISPAPELIHFLAELAQAFPDRTITIVHGYADPQRTPKSSSHTQGRALDLRINEIDCADIERFLVERPQILARLGCFPSTAFFHIDVGRSRGIWFDAKAGVE